MSSKDLLSCSAAGHGTLEVSHNASV